MGKTNKILKKALCLVLVTALLSSLLSMGAFAASNNYSGPKITGVSMNETRSQITLNFNREPELAASSFRGRIFLSQSGKELEVLPSDVKVSISGYRMQIILSSPLDTADNFFLITEGTLVNQSIEIESPLFDARGPQLAATGSVTANSSAKTVTIKFKSAIKGYPNDESLKNGYISLARNGTSFNEVIPAKNITINKTRGEIVVKIPDWISGNSAKIKIASGKLASSSTGNINISDIITPAIKVTSASSSSSSGVLVGSGSGNSYSDNYTYPQIDYTSISNDLKTVTVYFTERIKNVFAPGVSASLAASFLKSHVWVSRASKSNFQLLGGSDTLSVGSNYIKITFAEPLLKNQNYIKIEANSLTDEYDNLITENLVTENITGDTPSSSSSPVFASATLLANNKIAIYFTIPVIRNSSITLGEFRNSVLIARNGYTYEKISSYDSVSFSGNAMIIELETPLKGTSNRVRIQAGAVTSKLGNPLSTTVTTDPLDYDEYYDDSDDSYYASEPEYSRVTYDTNLRCIKVYFKNDIRLTSTADLHDSIYISRNSSSFRSLSSYDIVKISPQNAISITLDEPLSGTRNAVRIYGNTLSDYDTGYVLNDTITTDYFSAESSSDYYYDEEEYPEDTIVPSTGSAAYSGDISATLSDDFYTVTLKFNEPLLNNLSTLEQLKSKIQISRNGSFHTLTADDYIRVNDTESELVIVLAKPADEYFSQIKILSNSLRNASGRTISNAMITLPLGEAKGNARTYVDNKSFASDISMQLNGDNIIATFADEAQVTSLNKTCEILVKLPEEKNSATLNLSKNIVDSVKRYGGTFALSFGNATYYLPASNIPALSDGDTLSITIDKTSGAVGSLATAAGRDSFSIEVPAINLKASVVKASGEKTDVTHSAFAAKRFMGKLPTEGVQFTAIRIEKSGAIAPVPSKVEEKAGVMYITSKTLSDGDYAAISANHSFTNTPSWVQTPANTLGSRLILSNANGSDLNAGQAISRAETVTIMSKTLGVFCDSTGASPFFDMISTDSYFNAVMAAVSHKLISGYPDGTFKPSGTLTRAEAMTIVARAMRFMNGKPASASADMTASEAASILSKFTDAAAVDNWAKIDIAECVSAGVVNGDNNGRLNPKANVTRAELIQLMYNVLNKSNMLS